MPEEKTTEVKLNLTKAQLERLNEILKDPKPEGPAQADPIFNERFMKGIGGDVDEDKAMGINVVLHVKQWREVERLVRYRLARGNRRCKSISGLFWDLVDNAYNGMENAKKATQKQKKPQADAKEESAYHNGDGMFLGSEVRR